MAKLREHGSGEMVTAVNGSGLGALNWPAPFIGLALFVSFVVERALDGDPLLVVAWWGAGFAPLLWFVWVVASASLVAWENGIYVRNWFAEHWLPWNAVEELDSAAGRQLAIVLAGGRRLRVRSGGGELASAMRGRRRQAELRARIDQVRADAAADGQAAAVPSRRIVPHLPALLTMYAVFGVLFALLGLVVPGASW